MRCSWCDNEAEPDKTGCWLCVECDLEKWFGSCPYPKIIIEEAWPRIYWIR